jgi:hypothetical protein
MNDLEKENKELKKILKDIVSYSESYSYWVDHYWHHHMTTQKQAFRFLKEKVENAKDFLSKSKYYDER